MAFWLSVSGVVAAVAGLGWWYDRGRRRTATDLEFQAQRRQLRSDQGKGVEYGSGSSGPSDVGGLGGL